jgi:predicted metal-dependent enzyme (double-stranded beta helix superfamily)
LSEEKFKNITIEFALHSEKTNESIKIEIKHNQLSFYLNSKNLRLKVFDKTALLNYQQASYWLSIDSQNKQILYGIGEARFETRMVSFNYANILSENDAKLLIECIATLTEIKLPELQHYIQPIQLFRDPIVEGVPLIVKDTEGLSMNDIAGNIYMPKANLSPIAQKLYDNIAGSNFTLNTPDFPQFSQAIEYSIATPGCWCYNKLIEKQNEFSEGKPNPLQTYLRITLGKNSGESPGVPYVMEIWPPGHYSPIHNHAGANAIIRVLHGAITVKLFRFLQDNQAFAVTTFSEGDITWISPYLNQTHQLKNLDGNVETCITIQCYMYDTEDLTHYAYFNYLNDDTVEQFEPDSDADFEPFKSTIQKEWNKHLKQEEYNFF